MPKKPWGPVILCNTSGPASRCLLIDDRAPTPDCDPRCGEYRTPDNYIAACDWADRMLEHHDQKRCPGCGVMSIWVPHVAGDELGRAVAT